MKALDRQLAWLGAALNKARLRKRLPRQITSKQVYWRGWHAGAQEAHNIWAEAEVEQYYKRNRM